MATKTKKATQIGSTASTTINIPSAVRDTQPASGIDLLNQFVGTPTPVAEKKGKSRSVLNLGPEGTEVLRSFGAVKIAFDQIEAKSKTTSAELRSYAMPAWVKLLWDSKTQPSSPVMLANREDGKVDVDALFVVQERFKITATNPQQLIEGLIAFGVDKIKADALVKNEIDFSPFIAINFNELMNGKNVDGNWVPATPEEKAVANKALRLLMSTLTDAEKTLLINRKPKVSVKDGFFQRVTQYADTFEQLVGIIKVIDPTDFPSHAKFGVSDTPDDKNARLVQTLGDILGVKTAVISAVTVK